MDTFLRSIDSAFAYLHEKSLLLVDETDDRILFTRPAETKDSMAMFSIGEYIARSAAMVEQTFGGITTRLWDDPFEWTLPEKLHNCAGVVGYLSEVENARIDGFGFFTSDADLTREMPAPEKLRPLSDILISTIVSAGHYQGRAYSIFQMLSDKKLPRL